MVKVSVIIPIYGVENFIARCAESLLNQTLQEVEYIFVNDATLDKSMDILHSVFVKYSYREHNIKIINHESNQGLPAARNTGLQVASGEYIFHCDSDDYLEHNALESLYNVAVMKDLDIVWSDYVEDLEDRQCNKIQPSYNTPLDAIRGMLRGKMVYNVWNKLVRRRLYIDNNIVFPVRHTMGEDLTMVMLFACAMKVGYIHKSTYHYVKTNMGSVTRTYSKEKQDDLCYNVQRLECFLIHKFGNRFNSDIAWLKLNQKWFFLISDGRYSTYKKWNDCFQEANDYINWQPVTLRIRFVEWCASKRYYWIVWLHYWLVIRLFYRGRNILLAIKLEELKKRIRMSLKYGYPIAYLWLRKLHIVDSMGTINYVLKHGCSVSRFGDGEFNMIQGHGNGFQSYNVTLAKRLLQILKSNSTKKCIICIPYTLMDTSNSMPYPRDFWRFYGVRHFAFLYKNLSQHCLYYDSLVTRFYIDCKNKSLSEKHINELKKIWEGRNLLIVEGEKTRSGIGNDLFSLSLSIRRILAPAEDAFNRYDCILDAIKCHAHQDDLILLSLGMTATVLAYDLSNLGYQAIDLGHLDVEYEWFKMQAQKKVLLTGKYVNEVNHGNEVACCNDIEYQRQIICVIGVIEK